MTEAEKFSKEGIIDAREERRQELQQKFNLCEKE